MVNDMDTDSIKRAIDACEVISFDIFDTLLLRLCARAEDIFRIMEHKTGIRNFARERVIMQRRSSLEAESRGLPHCTFDGIYEYMQKYSKLVPNHTWSELKALELETEKRFLIKNEPMYGLFCYAKKAGKRVIAVSDMYLGEKEILPLLENCGYTGFDTVYISADVKKTKYRGDMYPYVLSRENVPAEKVLHIGDNKTDDIENAKFHGLNTFYYNTPKNTAKMPLFLSVCTGAANMLAAKSDDFWYGLGARVGGPLYCAFIPMLLGELARIQPDKLFLLSRDGYNLFEIMKKLGLTDIKTEYFHTSRRALLLCGIDRLDTAAKSVLPPFTFGQSVGEILEYLDMADMDEKCVKAAGFTGFDDIIKDVDDHKKFRNIFDFCPDYFTEKVREEREGFEKYLKTVGYTENSLIFDAGWNGSSQFLLDRALALMGLKASRFVYFGLMSTRKRFRQLAGKDYNALVFDKNKNPALFQRLRRSIVLLELFFGAPEAAVWKYTKDGFLYEKTDEDLEYKSRILQGISDCVSAAYPILKEYRLKGTAKDCLAPVLRLIERPTEREAVMIGDLENADAFAARKGVKKYIAKLEESDLTPELNEFYWPMGIYARGDISQSVKEFVQKKTGVKMPEKAEQKPQKRPNVFVRLMGHIRNYGLVTTGRLVLKRLTAKSGQKAYEAYIAASERDISKTEELPYKPLFSFVVPVYNTEEKILRECIDSVLAQTYQNFELILVDDKSDTESVVPTLESYKNKPNITLIFRKENGGISRCTNTGIEAAKGEYIVFMDCDDTVAPNAVYELTKAVNEDRNADFIYTDEDKLNEQGKRTEPHFKPDWSPDTFMSLMYTSHLSAYRASLVRELGGLRSEFDGAQDYDLTLRFTERTKNIVHIPKVLYHWRVQPHSVASDISAKPYVLKAVEGLKKDALKRRGLDGRVVFVPDVQQYRVVYTPKNSPLVSIIIPSKDNFEVFERCVNSIIAKTEYKNYEMIVVDNGSNAENTAKYAALCKKIKAVYKREEEEFNFPRMCNKGAGLAKGDILLFLNDDTEVRAGGWLEAMAGQAALDHAGAVGAKLLYPNGSVIQHCGILNLPIGPCHALAPFDDAVLHYFCRNRLDYNYLAVTAACLCIEKKKFDEVHGFDESFAVAYNDVELCFKLHEKGYFNSVRNDVVLYHHESLSRGHDEKDREKHKRQMAEMDRLYALHPSLRGKDPFYNENLAGDRVDFAVKQV